MTESEALSIGQETEAVRYAASSGIQGAGARVRAKPSLAAAPAAPEAVTDGERAAPDIQARAQGFADSLAARWQAKLGDTPPLVHARPPSLAMAHKRLHDNLAHYDAALMKALAGTYGYAYLTLLAGAYAVLWTLRSFWGLLVALFTVFVFIRW